MKKTQLQDFAKKLLTRAQQQQTKGGRETLPGLIGSTGLVGWDEVDVRIKDKQTLHRPSKLSA